MKETVLKFEKEHHSFLQKEKGEVQGKLLVTYTPAGFENFFRELGQSNARGF